MRNHVSLFKTLYYTSKQLWVSLYRFGSLVNSPLFSVSHAIRLIKFCICMQLQQDKRLNFWRYLHLHMVYCSNSKFPYIPEVKNGFWKHVWCSHRSPQDSKTFASYPNIYPKHSILWSLLLLESDWRLMELQTRPARTINIFRITRTDFRSTIK